MPLIILHFVEVQVEPKTKRPLFYIFLGVEVRSAGCGARPVSLRGFRSSQILAVGPKIGLQDLLRFEASNRGEC